MKYTVMISSGSSTMLSNVQDRESIKIFLNYVLTCNSLHGSHKIDLREIIKYQFNLSRYKRELVIHWFLLHVVTLREEKEVDDNKPILHNSCNTQVK